MDSLPRCPLVPVSWGEVIDKITILELKAERIAEPAARANVADELARLAAVAAPALAAAGVRALAARLGEVNARLWAIEDAIRELDRAGDFGPRFVELARAVHATNDARAALKRELNALLGSELVEEKCYAGGARAQAAG